MDKVILDMTCGSRSMWFNKKEPHTVYVDKRNEEYDGVWTNPKSEKKLIINPDIQCDFTALPFESDSFNLVLFDPPHLIHAKETAWLVKRYGKLDDTWPELIHDGFKEGMRVLKPNGTLVFKWSEYDIPAEKVWHAIGQTPLFGIHSGRKAKTFFGVFMKFDEVNNEPDR